MERAFMNASKVYDLLLMWKISQCPICLDHEEVLTIILLLEQFISIMNLRDR